jgi:hypothetical protein
MVLHRRVQGPLSDLCHQGCALQASVIHLIVRVEAMPAGHLLPPIVTYILHQVDVDTRGAALCLHIMSCWVRRHPRLQPDSTMHSSAPYWLPEPAVLVEPHRAATPDHKPALVVDLACNVTERAPAFNTPRQAGQATVLAALGAPFRAAAVLVAGLRSPFVLPAEPLQAPPSGRSAGREVRVGDAIAGCEGPCTMAPPRCTSSQSSCSGTQLSAIVSRRGPHRVSCW